MSRVIYFEIQADDINRAIQFYKKVFGWDFKQLDNIEYCLIITGPEDQRGINGGLMRRIVPISYRHDSIKGYICTINVPSVDDYCKRIIDSGGTIEMNKMSIPGAGWIAYCKDTENNIFGIIEMNVES
jgi:uncharacterized protein